MRGKVGGRVEAVPQRLTEGVDGVGEAQSGEYFVVGENAYGVEGTGIRHIGHLETVSFRRIFTQLGCSTSVAFKS